MIARCMSAMSRSSPWVKLGTTVVRIHSVKLSHSLFLSMGAGLAKSSQSRTNHHPALPVRRKQQRVQKAAPTERAGQESETQADDAAHRRSCANLGSRPSSQKFKSEALAADGSCRRFPVR